MAGFDLSKTKSANKSNVREKVSSFEKGIRESNSKIYDIPLSLISLHPENAKFYSMENINELADLIAKQGVLQPVILRKMDEESYQLLAGERRYRACLQNKLSTIPSFILDDLSDTDAKILLISTNFYRVKTPVEQAREVRALVELYKEKEEEEPGFLRGRKATDVVAGEMDISAATVHRAVRLTSLIPELQQLTESKKIAASSLHIFSSLSEENQKQIYDVISSLDTFSREEATLLKEQIESMNASNELAKKEMGEIKAVLQEKEAELSDIRAQDNDSIKVESLKKQIQQLKYQLKEKGEQSANVVSDPLSDRYTLDTESLEAKVALSSLNDIVDQLIKKNSEVAQKESKLSDSDKDQYREILSRLSTISPGR